MEVASLPTALIYPRPDGMRPIDKRHVEALADSIREIGLQQPIVVRKSRVVRSGTTCDGYEIMAGHHRYEACAVTLNWIEIPCVVSDKDDLLAELIAIDENLCRAELKDAERAYQTARRKEIYETLHPETAHGAIGNGREKSRQIGDSTNSRFSKEVARNTGRSERAVQRDAARGEALGDDLKRIAGTSLDKGVEIDALTRLSANDREDLVARAHKGERVSARNVVRLAPEPTDDAEAVERQVAAIMNAWNKAGPEARRIARERLDEPLMDRRYGAA